MKGELATRLVDFIKGLNQKLQNYFSLQSGNLPNKETSSRMIYIKLSKSDWLLYTDDRHSFLTFAKFHCGLDIIRINSKRVLVFIIILNHSGSTLFEKVNET